MMAPPRVQGGGQSKCDYCPSVFARGRHYFTHARKKHAEEISRLWLPCNECNLLFPGMENILKHQSSVHKTVSLNTEKTLTRVECSFCQKILGSARKYNAHANKIHQDSISKSWFSCDTCGKFYPSDQSLKNHRKLSDCEDKDKSKWPQCQFCNKIISRQYLYFTHANKDHPDLVRDLWIRCNQCDMYMPNVKAMKHHINGHVIKSAPKDKEKKALCDFCPKVFRENNGYYKHANTKHNEFVVDQWHQCNICRMYFPTTTVVGLHKSIKHRKIDPMMNRIQCNFCVQTFLRRDRFISHANKEHLEDVQKEWFQCEICSLYQPTQCNLKNHQIAAHKKEFVATTSTSIKKLRQKSSVKSKGNEDNKNSPRIKPQRHVESDGGHLCPDCGDYFTTEKKLFRHVSKVHVSKSIKCQFCQVSFGDMATYISHANERHPDEVSQSWFHCDCCNLYLSGPAQLQEHQIEEHGMDTTTPESLDENEGQSSHSLPDTLEEDSLKSQEFVEVYFKEEMIVTEQEISEQDESRKRTEGNFFIQEDDTLLRVNIIEDQSTVKEVPYPDEPHPEDTVIKPETNETTLTDVSNLQCDLCGRLFRKAIHLKRHLVSVHPDNVSCSICQEVFNDESEMNSHVLEAHTSSVKKEKIKSNDSEFDGLDENDESEFNCSDCGKSFSKMLLLNRHINQIHSEVTRTCEHCNKIFEDVESLVQHIKKLHGEKTLTCEKCKKQFIRNKDLLKHCRRLKHDSSLQCDKCENIFKSWQQFKDHDLKVHSNETKKKKEKIQYQVSKTGDKYVECPECGKRFNRNCSMLKHLKAIHHEVKDQKCQFCGKTFSASSHLKRHIDTIHLNQKNNICEHCGWSFYERGRLKQHLQFHHKIDLQIIE